MAAINPCGDATRPVPVAGTSGIPAAAPIKTDSLSEHGKCEIDRGHLARMTLGDPHLECEILALFHRQAEMLLGRMANRAPKVVAAFAHTLTGSARGVGAWQVAAAAEAVARAAIGSDGAGMEKALGSLSTAVARAQAAIADLTRAC